VATWLRSQVGTISIDAKTVEFLSKVFELVKSLPNDGEAEADRVVACGAQNQKEPRLTPDKLGKQNARLLRTRKLGG
jgi:hypothetical protein